MTGGYFFLPAADLAATAAPFFWLALLTAAFFWPDFFWLAFGDLSPIFFFFLRIDLPAAWNFLRRKGHRAVRPEDCKWRRRIYLVERVMRTSTR